MTSTMSCMGQLLHDHPTSMDKNSQTISAVDIKVLGLCGGHTLTYQQAPPPLETCQPGGAPAGLLNPQAIKTDATQYGLVLGVLKRQEGVSVSCST